MRITKVVREHMEQVIGAKRLEANKKERAEYDARRKSCREELDKLLNSINEDVLDILRKYDMDEETMYYGRKRSAPEAIFQFYDQYITNASEEEIYNTNARSRKATQDAEIKRIELEAALGADKEAFMAMLEAVTF